MSTLPVAAERRSLLPWATALGALTLCGLLGVSLAQDASPPPSGPQETPTATPKESVKHTNRLVHEKSPYLRQHAHNPVDWYPWGEEAFAKAKKENKLVFLSIGYATCHWCHVMERESFENDEIAAYLNEHYVAIKVDREERPDVDEIYMRAILNATGSGGWPLSVWLTPDAHPLPDVAEFQQSWGSALTGGTYFPQPARFGRRAFLSELKVRVDLWSKHSKALVTDAKSWTAGLAQSLKQQGKQVKLQPRALTAGVAGLAKVFDSENGGFGGGGPTRFPMPHTLSFLLRQAKRSGDASTLGLATTTLDSICNRGLRDHLAGGFHRYSVDPKWAIPHFEKMLYDQAGLIRALAEAHALTGEARYAEVARETADFVLSDMRDAKGGFTSAWDADSEGEEGKFYVWSEADLRKVLGDRFELFATRYQVSKEGNFEEHPGQHDNHLQLAELDLAKVAKARGLTLDATREGLASCRKALLAVRSKRIPPLHDDKILTDWNGLMIGALAYAGRTLGEPRYIEAARRAAEFVYSDLHVKGVLHHRWREGEAKVEGLLEDYAFLTWGLLDLYEATYDPRWLKEAGVLADGMIKRFWDAEGHGFFLVTAKSGLIARPKPTYDGAIPSGNSVAAFVLLRLGATRGDPKLFEKGEQTLMFYSQLLAHHGGRAASLGLSALDFSLGPRREVVIVGDPKAPETRALLREVERRYLPRTITLLRPPGDAAALVAEVSWVGPLTAIDKKPTAYVCLGFACKAPVFTPQALGKLLDAPPPGPR
ncbi:MAG: thioredoxin domain-containing protein [Planctomycetes bacterium]|nr:thioredoxin domain-containing protein [Planctomycetota bacterium]